MIGGFQPPFRPGCGTHPGYPKYFFGLPFQHRRPGDVPVDAFGNSTEMLDHCLNTIGAKSLDYQQDACGENLCIGGECSECPGGFDLTINTPRPPAISANTWEQVGTVDLIPQRKLGFKNVQAFKRWHGRYGFDLDSNGADCDTGALSNTKYRTVRVQVTALTDDMTAPGTDVRSLALDYTLTVNRLTGVAELVSFAYSETSPQAMSYLGFIDCQDGVFGAQFNTPVWAYLQNILLGMTCCHQHDAHWNYSYPGVFVGDV